MIRRETAIHELEQLGKFNYLVINQEGKLDETVETVLDIINAEHNRVK